MRFTQACLGTFLLPVHRASGIVLRVTVVWGWLVMCALAADWPQWRGPQRDGHSPEKGLLSEWPDEGPPLLWTASGLGSGYASVGVVGDRIYTVGMRQNKTTFLIALDQHANKLWETPLSDNEEPPNGTPTVSEGRVYVVTFRGVLACCDAQTGELLWKKDYTRQFRGRMMSGWGYSESPLIDGDRVVCTPGGSQAMLVALDKHDGKTIWTTVMPDNLGPKGNDGAAYSSIVISHGGGVKQYVQLVGRGVIGVDAHTGKLLWNYNKIANGTANIPTPIVSGNYVFASTGYGDGGSALLEIQRAENRRVGIREVYYFPSNQLQNHHGGMILVDKFLYLGHGHNNGFPVCLEMATGQVAWRPGRGPGSGSAAVAYADGHLYFRYQDGTMALIEANPREYRLKGKFRLATHLGEGWPHPAIANGCLFLRDQDVLMCYDIHGSEN